MSVKAKLWLKLETIFWDNVKIATAKAWEYTTPKSTIATAIFVLTASLVAAAVRWLNSSASLHDALAEAVRRTGG